MEKVFAVLVILLASVWASAQVPISIETVHVAGTAQVETATVVGTIGASGAGNATVVVTGQGVIGSPLTVPVAVANNDTASQVAGKIRTALGISAITTNYTVSGAGADIILTSNVTTASNDTTLNISTDNGTCSGLTPAPTSVDTLAGAAGLPDPAENPQKAYYVDDGSPGNPCGAGGGVVFTLCRSDGGDWIAIGNITITTTVSGLPSAAANEGQVYYVYDGDSSGGADPCTVGGGTGFITCRSNGAAWVSAASSILIDSASEQIMGNVGTGSNGGTKIWAHTSPNYYITLGANGSLEITTADGAFGISAGQHQWYFGDPNTNDIGGDGSSTAQPLRSGYFHTSVITPLISGETSGGLTLSTADVNGTVNIASGTTSGAIVLTGQQISLVAPGGGNGVIVDNNFSVGGNATINTAIINTGITADTALVDTSVCQDTTNHQFYSGSGTLGVCLGLSTLASKSNVLSLGPGLNEILKLKPISFTYKPGVGFDPSKIYYGLGAEDVFPVLPRLVHLGADGKPRGVDLLGMVPVIIKSVQQLNDKIEAQQKVINKLRATSPVSSLRAPSRRH